MLLAQWSPATSVVRGLKTLPLSKDFQGGLVLLYRSPIRRHATQHEGWRNQTLMPAVLIWFVYVMIDLQPEKARRRLYHRINKIADAMQDAGSFHRTGS